MNTVHYKLLTELLNYFDHLFPNCAAYSFEKPFKFFRCIVTANIRSFVIDRELPQADYIQLKLLQNGMCKLTPTSQSSLAVQYACALLVSLLSLCVRVYSSEAM